MQGHAGQSNQYLFIFDLQSPCLMFILMKIYKINHMVGTIYVREYSICMGNQMATSEIRK